LSRTVAFAYSGKNFPTVSSNDALPWSTSCANAVAVNILPSEPMVNWVDGVKRRSRVRSANPAVSVRNGFPSRAAIAMPLKASAA